MTSKEYKKEKPNSDDGKYFIYVMECSDGSLYTGITNDTEKRLKVHNSGKGAKYTRGRLPVKIVYREEVQTKGEALSRERQIKKLKREDKLELIRIKRGETQWKKNTESQSEREY